MLCCAPGNQHVFYTTINKRPPIVFLRRSRRISCTGVPCRNPSARDPSLPAQDDKSGAVVLSQRQGWGPGGVGWSAGRICRCPAGAGAFGRGRCRGSHRRAGARPRRPLSGSCAPDPNAMHLQVCHCEPARTLVWQSVPLQAAGLRVPPGAQHRPGGITGLTAGAMLRIA